MPSREEIANDILSIANWCEDQAASSELEDLAAHVENISCEKCSHYTSKNTCSFHNGFFWPQQDGCFSWEAKECAT